MESDKMLYENMLLSIVKPLKDHFSPGCARLELVGGMALHGPWVAGLEGFSRLLWGMVPYWAGGGRDESMLPIFQKGLINGTDPGSPEYWGDLSDKDQRIVEMAAISNGFLLIPEKLWEPLPEEAKNNVAAWLGQINSYSTPENNWKFFAVMANLALKKLGRDYSQECIEQAAAVYESFYLGNGWYSDGRRPHIDYYASFGIHYYCLLYAYYMGEEDPERATLYRSRATEFAQSFLYWFDEEGRALPFGRSLTYRFAQVSFFSVCIMTGVECLPLGVMKGLVKRHLEYWLSQPIYDNGGVLSIGYNYPNLTMSEGYNAAGSPYWALKAFAFLALPQNHVFWSQPAEDLPRCQLWKAIPECRMLLHHKGKEVIAYTAGQYPKFQINHGAEKYAKFAYSTVFGFSVPRSYCDLIEAAPDSMLAFHVNGMYYVRRVCEKFEITEEGVYAKWNPLDGIEVETWIQPTKKGHIRRHRIYSKIACKAYDCGFAYPYNREETQLICKEKDAIVSDHRGESMAHSETGRGIIIQCVPNTNLVHPITKLPAIEYDIPEGRIELITEIEANREVVE